MSLTDAQNCDVQEPDQVISDRKMSVSKTATAYPYANSCIRPDDRPYRCVVLIDFSFLKQRWLALSKLLVKRFVKILERPTLLIYGHNQRLGQWSPSTVL